MHRWLFIVVLISFSCAGDAGKFAFHPVDEQRFNDIQRVWYTPSHFTRFTPPILFDENKTIWFSYKPDKVNYKEPYAISLSRRSLGWIEIDLKNVMLNSEVGYIVENYPDLETGEYLLRIAFNDEIIGSTTFEVIRDHDQKSEFIDYDLPLEVVLDTEADDIRMLSRE